MSKELIGMSGWS